MNKTDLATSIIGTKIDLNNVNGVQYKPYQRQKYIIYMDEYSYPGYKTYYIINNWDMIVHDIFKVKIRSDKYYQVRVNNGIFANYELNGNIVFLKPKPVVFSVSKEYCLIAENNIDGFYIYDLDKRSVYEKISHNTVTFPDYASNKSVDYSTDVDTLVKLNFNHIKNEQSSYGILVTDFKVVVEIDKLYVHLRKDNSYHCALYFDINKTAFKVNDQMVNHIPYIRLKNEYPRKEELLFVPTPTGGYIVNLDKKVCLYHSIENPAKVLSTEHYSFTLNELLAFDPKKWKENLSIDSKLTPPESKLTPPDSDSDSDSDSYSESEYESESETNTNTNTAESAKPKNDIDDHIKEILSKKELMNKAVEDYTAQLVLLQLRKQKMLEAINDYTKSL